MEKNAKFVFFGTPRFAEIIMEKLVNAGYLPSVVICNPDRPVGRNKTITPPPVKQNIMYHVSRIKEKIKIWQPEKLDVKSYMLNVGEMDFGVVAAYTNIISKEILDTFRLGVIGVHPSLLPKYRGASPIQSSILSGEEETGLTLYLMDEKMDHGPILAQNMYHVAQNTTYLELMEALAKLGGALLVETLPKFLAGEVRPQEQNHKEATFTRKFVIGDGFVEEKDLKLALSGDQNLAIQINSKIHALNPEPGVWTEMDSKRIKLLKSVFDDQKLELIEIQLAGKKPTTDLKHFTVNI